MFSAPFSFINFYNKMGTHLMDTYLIVLMAVMEIASGGYEIKEDMLITSLHNTIIQMHNQSLVHDLMSCLKETIATALSRYVKLDLLSSKSVSN